MKKSVFLRLDSLHHLLIENEKKKKKLNRLKV